MKTHIVNMKDITHTLCGETTDNKTYVTGILYADCEECVKIASKAGQCLRLNCVLAKASEDIEIINTYGDTNDQSHT